jgi:hypothetical protein
MVRHLVRVASANLALVVCLSVLTGRVEAQTIGAGVGDVSDPFAFYYAIYLPNQQLQAMRPGPLDAVDNAMVARQYYAQTQRRSLYNPISPYSDTYDPLHPYSPQDQERSARPYRFAHDPSNYNGNGPSLYYNRVVQYYPDLAGRQMRKPNGNIVSSRRSGGARGGRGGGMGGGGMGGGGMGGMGMGGGMGGGMGMGGMGGMF